MLTNAIIVGFVVMLVKFFDWYGNISIQRPIVCVPILGLLLGYPTEGLILGAQLELIFLGNVSLGGVMPTDFTLGSIFGAAFAMMLGKDIESAVMLAVPISMLGTLLYSGMKIVVTSLVPVFEKQIENKNIKAFNRLWVAQLAGFSIAYFFLGFIVTLVGADAVGSFINWLPVWVQSAMTVASKMLPAVGLALLLKTLWTKTSAAYYFLGFALGAFFFYTKATGVDIVDGVGAIASAPTKMLSLVQISFIAAAVAVIVVLNELNSNKKNKISENIQSQSADESEDFFNEY